MAIRPRLSGIVEGLVVAAIVGVGSTIAAVYQDGLRAQEKAQVHLDPLGSSLAALPPSLVVALGAALAFVVALLALFIIHRLAYATPEAASAPHNADEINELKRKIAEQTDEVYLAKTERDDMRRERDALKEKCDRVSSELETVQSTAQSQQRALLQDLGDRMSKADSQKLLGELVDARAERDAALADKAAIVKSLPVPPREALLRGEVARFEMLDFNLVIKHQMASFERQHGRGITTLEYIQSGIGTHGIVYYAAWLKLEAAAQTKATDWTAAVLHKDGALVTCEFVATDWGRPESWPPIEYRSSSEVQNMILQPRELYNVLLHVSCQLSDFQLNMNSFTARFLDDNGTEVVCSMKQPGAYK
jgi:hypothetical protein